MSSFKVIGGRRLQGEIIPSGAKNAALKMIAAACLTDEEVVIANVPKIRDVITMVEILESIGAIVKWKDDTTVSINCSSINPDHIDQVKVGNLRGSIVLIGPLLARFGKLKIHEPGGCVIGARSINTHLNAFRNLGVKTKQDGKYIIFETNGEKLTGTRIVLDEISVTATENALMAATLCQGSTEIHLAAVEPEIANLIELLRKMGANISGENTNILKIVGADKLTGASIRVIPDRIEIGTFAIAAVATGGGLTIKNVIRDHLDNLINKFDQMGVNYSFNEEKQLEDKLYCDLTISPGDRVKAINFDARPYPGFPTDLQSPMVLLLTQAQGKSKIVETLFDGRLDYTNIFNQMGANITALDSRTIIIQGPTKLAGANIDSPDLRAGAAFVIAGLIAEGESIINNAEMIDRGYENFEVKLQKLGAEIRRVEV